jgi:hypothetical protein
MKDLEHTLPTYLYYKGAKELENTICNKYPNRTLATFNMKTCCNERLEQMEHLEHTVFNICVKHMQLPNQNA